MKSNRIKKGGPYIFEGRVAASDVVLRDTVDVGHARQVLAFEVFGLQGDDLLKVYERLQASNSSQPSSLHSMDWRLSSSRLAPHRDSAAVQEVCNKAQRAGRMSPNAACQHLICMQMHCRSARAGRCSDRKTGSAPP